MTKAGFSVSMTATREDQTVRCSSIEGSISSPPGREAYCVVHVVCFIDSPTVSLGRATYKQKGSGVKQSVSYAYQS